MAEITAAIVAKLREMTGAGLMDCKKALTECQGDINAACDLLRKKGSATAVSKSSREAKEGVVAQYIAPGGRLGVLVEVNCETDFVARNEMFRGFADEVAKKLAAKADVAKIRENIKIPRNARMEVQGNGLVAAYIHTGGKVGVLVEVGAGKEATVSSDDFKQLVRDITLQIAAGHPSAVTRDQVPADLLAKEKEIAADQVKNKPPQAVAKIIEGKLEKFYQTYCLMDQGFVKKNSEVSLKEHMGGVAKQLGDEITIRRFVRFQVGEVAT